MDFIPFALKEFIITQPKTVELDIADKLWKWHIIPMITIRVRMGVKIWASLKSGYRPKWYELQKGRSGNSEHCFEGRGAVDWTFDDFDKNVDEFVKLLQQHTRYTRISVYHDRKFVHCDYKNHESDAYVYYFDETEGIWERNYPIKRAA